MNFARVLVVFLTLFLFSNCAPAVFKSTDVSGNSVDITGLWEGMAKIKSIQVTSKYGTNSANLGEEDKKYSNVNLKFTIRRGKEENQIAGSATHFYLNTLGTFNEVPYGEISISGNPRQSSWIYTRRSGSSFEEVHINGEFIGDNFSGTMRRSDDFQVKTFFPDGSVEVERQTTVSEYLVTLTRK